RSRLLHFPLLAYRFHFRLHRIVFLFFSNFVSCLCMCCTTCICLLRTDRRVCEQMIHCCFYLIIYCFILVLRIPILPFISDLLLPICACVLHRSSCSVSWSFVLLGSLIRSRNAIESVSGALHVAHESM